MNEKKTVLKIIGTKYWSQKECVWSFKYKC